MLIGHTGLWSILPIVVAIACAVVTRQVILALFLGVYVGVLTTERCHPLAALTSLIRDYLVVQLTDAYDAGIDLINTDHLEQLDLFSCLDRGSRANSKNSHLFSYPGYAEILNGAPLPSIDSNDAVFSPRKTVLEYVREELGLERRQVACFASWRVFDWITRQSESTIFSNAGYEAVPEALATEGMSIFHRLQKQMMTPWDSTRHDRMTFGLAMEYIRAHEPRVFYLAAGETHDWAHERRYDRTLHAVQLFDDALRELWTHLQSTEPYRDRSTLIVTTDHGRGRTPDDWTSHGKDVPGADEIWIGVFGPDTPKVGEATTTGEHYQSQIAATMLELLGLDYRSFNPSADAPIAEAFLR